MNFIKKEKTALYKNFLSTGYLNDRQLNSFIASSDIFVNLRYPSFGESSGVLARALNTRTCCVVSDYGGFSYLDSEIVVKVGPDFTSFKDKLDLLIHSESLRTNISLKARKITSKSMNIQLYCEKLKSIIEQYS